MKNEKSLNDYYQPNVDNDIIETISTKPSIDLQLVDIYFTKEGDKVVENWVYEEI